MMKLALEAALKQKSVKIVNQGRYSRNSDMSNEGVDKIASKQLF